MSTRSPIRFATLLLLGLVPGCSQPPLALPPVQAVSPNLTPGATWQRWEDPASRGWDTARLEQARRLWEGNSGTSAVMIVQPRPEISQP